MPQRCVSHAEDAHHEGNVSWNPCTCHSSLNPLCKLTFSRLWKQPPCICLLMTLIQLGCREAQQLCCVLVMKLLLPGKDRFQMSETEPIKIQAVNSFHEGSRKDVWQEGRICSLLGCKYYFLHLFQSCSSTVYKTQCWVKALFLNARWERRWGFPYTSKLRGKVQ